MAHEIGQGAALAEHKTTFMTPGTNQMVTWRSDNRFSTDLEHLDLLSLDFVDGVPYVATTPNRSSAYIKWNRPNPPYVFFKYVGEWERISLEEFPEEFKINVVTTSLKNEQYKKRVVADIHKYGFIRAETVAKINSEPGSNKAYYTILRTPINYGPLLPNHSEYKVPASGFCPLRQNDTSCENLFVRGAA